MNEVFLRSIFLWTCTECGHENRHHGARIKDPELLEDLRQDMTEAEGSFEPSEFVTLPEFVYCQKCEEKHRVAGEITDE
jgi:hypothetical protein